MGDELPTLPRDTAPSVCVCVYAWISVTVLLWLTIIESTIVFGELKYFEFA